ncbi:MAG: methyltransferase domain-containing protein [Acidimicrobiia bacterium]|nr:methyltransferase domain-containing protein [Acidimicrobiia bacterium]
MKAALVERLACPISGGPLRLVPFETEEVDSPSGPMTVTREGVLVSDRANVCYPVSRFVPVLLTFRTPFHDRFRAEHRERVDALAGLQMPDGPCEQGERAVQETFTEEWALTHDSELSFARTHEDLVQLNREVFLPWLNGHHRVGRLLDVGCGIGRETLALREVASPRETVAVDLNFALLDAAGRYRHLPDAHFVIASVFHLPFPRAAFDVVYSHGVIHHTWSARAAFDRLAAQVAPGGHLFVWVYGLGDHLMFGNAPTGSWRQRGKHLVRRAAFGAEALVRPGLSRAPRGVRRAVVRGLATLLHPVLQRRVAHRGLWTRANTEHSLRDWLTPRYAHRHDVNEIVEWYEDRGFRIVGFQSAAAYRRLCAGRPIFGVGVTGQRVATPDRGQAG